MALTIKGTGYHVQLLCKLEIDSVRSLSIHFLLLQHSDFRYATEQSASIIPWIIFPCLSLFHSFWRQWLVRIEESSSRCSFRRILFGAVLSPREEMPFVGDPFTLLAPRVGPAGGHPQPSQRQMSACANRAWMAP